MTSPAALSPPVVPDSTTKESLAWFQKRRDRWRAAPRRKVQSLTPKKDSNSTANNVETLQDKTNTAAITTTWTHHSNASPFTPVTAQPPAAATTTRDSTGSASSTSSLTAKVLFGASSNIPNPFANATKKNPLAADIAKPLAVVAAPSKASDDSTTTATKPSISFASPPAVASTQSKSTANPFARITLTPATKVAETTTKPTTTTFGATSSSTTNPFAKLNLTPSTTMTKEATSTTQSTSSKPPSTTNPFSKINLTPSTVANTKPAAASTTTSSLPKSTTNPFSNINLTPSTTNNKAAATSIGSSSAPKRTTNPFAKINLTPSTTTSKPPEETKTSTVANPFAKLTLTPSAPASVKPVSTNTVSTKTPSAPTNPFANITLTPSTTTTGSAPTDKPTKESSSAAPAVGTSTAQSLVKPATKSRNAKPNSNRPPIGSTTLASSNPTTSFGSTTFGSTTTSFGGSKTNPFGKSSFSINLPSTESKEKESVTTNKSTSLPERSKEASSSSSIPSTSTTDSKPLFGTNPASNPFTFGATPAKSPFMLGSLAKTSSPLFGATGTTPSPFTLGAKPAIAEKSSAPPKSKAEEKDTPANGLEESEDATDYKTKLEEFYKQHNPEKLNTVDATLEKYKGKEEELFEKLKAKYGPTPYPRPQGDGPICYLEFSIDGEVVEGKVHVKLFADKVPLACENFQALCNGSKGKSRSGKPLCYKHCKVHRVVEFFCVQLGDFTRGDGTGGESIFEPNRAGVSDSMGRFKDEAFLQHSKRGLVSMANNGANRNGSQFFFTLRPCHSLDGKHVVFGEVVKGMDIIDKIGKLPTNPKQSPTKPVQVSDCGEIVDGKEVPCQVAAAAPSPSPFGASGAFGSSSSGFGALAASGKTGFGASASPFTFGSSTSSAPTSFGSLAAAGGTPSTSSMFGGTSKGNPSPFTFGAGASSTKTTSIFGSSQNPSPFGASAAASSPFGSAPAFRSGAPSEISESDEGSDDED